MGLIQNITLIIILFVAVTGCSSMGNYHSANPMIPDDDNKQQYPPSYNNRGKKPLDITPLTTFSGYTSGNGRRFNNAYTRIRITSFLESDKLDKSQSDPLLYEARNIFSRYLFGKKFDVNLSAKIKVGGYEATVPLMTIGHQSNSDGELWSRSVKHNLFNFPLFLVKGDGETSIPDVRFILSGSKEYSSSMAATALQVSLAAIQEILPESTVLTKLTAQSTRDTARAIDSTVAKLFSSGIYEEHVSDCDFREWKSKHGMKIQLYTTAGTSSEYHTTQPA